MTAAASPLAIEMMPPVSPYRGLAPYGEGDAAFFFGRDREREVIVANLMARRLTLVYGESGVGKSSLLRAGALAHTRQAAVEQVAEHGRPEFVPLVYAAWRDDPVAGLVDAARRAVGELVPNAAAAAVGATGLEEAFSALTDAVDCELLVVLDQFEEYFLYHPDEDGPGTFAVELPRAIARRDLPANFLLCIREDALGKLDYFKTRIPGLFENYLRIDHLDRIAAEQAIREPIEEFNRRAADEAQIEIEATLVDAVLEQVAAGRVIPEQAGAGVVDGTQGVLRVETPYLQLVMSRLWDEEMRVNSHTLRLATLERLGGAREIVRTHLDYALGRVSEDERRVAAEAFHHLVTPSGTKIAHRRSDLAEYTGRSDRELAAVLDTLSSGDIRILRPVPPPPGDPGTPRYEIFHDVLASAILDWRTRYETERTLADERQAARRRQRKLLGVVGASFVALALMLLVTVYAFVQRREAHEQAEQARAQEAYASEQAARASAAARRAKARELDAEAIAQLPVDPELGLLLATEAARLSATAQADSVLRQALLASRLRAVFDAGSPVVSASYSRDGRRIMVASADGKVRTFDAGLQRVVRTLDARARLRHASLSVDSRLIITTDERGTVRVWRTATATQLRVLRHRARVVSASLSTDGEFVVTATTDRIVRVWRVRDGVPVMTLQLDAPVQSAAFSPNGRFIAAVSNTRAHLFDSGTGGRVDVFEHGARITAAQFNPSGSLFITAGFDRARVWGLRRRFVNDLRGPVGRVLAVAVDDRGRYVATASSEGIARVWRLPSGDLRSVLVGHTNPVNSVAFRPDGFSIVTTSADRTARIWQPDTGSPRAVLSGHTESVTGAAFRPDGRVVVTASSDGTARAWDPRAQPELEAFARFDTVVGRAAVSPDGRLIAVAGRNGIRLLRWPTGTRVRHLAGAPAADVDFSPDGRLIGAAVGRHAAVWRTRSGVLVRRLPHAGRVSGVAFSGDGRRLATSSVDRAARLWRLDGRLVRVLRGHRGPLTSLAFSPDGERLVTGSTDDTARIWNTATGASERVLTGHEGDVMSAKFSRDGKLIVTGSRDRDARTWDATTGQPRRVFRGHFAAVNDASFSPNGRWVVTAGPRIAGLWDAATGRALLFLRGHSGALTSAAFDPAGRRIITAGLDGTVRRYRCDVCGGTESLLGLARRRLALTGRKLTAAERRAYLER
jgi:WD40 repeat protein